MEISFAYRIRSENPSRSSININDRSIALSPNHKTFCNAEGSFLNFSSNEEFKQVHLDLATDEYVTCIGTVQRIPWIVGVGTNFGKIFLVSHQNAKVIKSLELHKNALAVEINETPENENFSVISILLSPNIVVLIPSDDISAIISNPGFKPAMYKVSIDTQQKITKTSISFPKENSGKIKLFSAGSDNFLTASYIPKPQSNGALSKIATSMNIFGKSFNESPPNHVLSTAFSIEDKLRRVVSMKMSVDSKYLVISDTQGRLSILDTETNCFVITRKDLVDTQLAWYKNEDKSFLVVLSDKRRCIYVVKFPEMNVVDAISIEEGGKLIQNIDGNNNDGVIYIDGNGNIAILNPKQHRLRGKTEEPTEKCVSRFFSHDEFKTNIKRNDNVIQEVINSLSSESADEESIVRILNDIDDIVLAAQVISTIIKFDNVSDDFLKHCISVLQLSLDYCPTSPPSLRRQIDNYINNFKGGDIIPEDEFARYVSLAEIWTRAMLVEQEVIPITEFPQTTITKWYTRDYEHQSVEMPKYLPLRLFLAEPMKNFSILFASLRRDATYVDLIKIMITVHPSSIDEFLQYFIFWCATITPSHLALIQNVIVGLAQHNLREAMVEQYNNIPDIAAETNKQLFMRILSE